MSYTLKIIKSFIYSSSSSADEVSTNNFMTAPVLNFTWIENFYKNKGVAHLLSLITKFKREHFNSNLGYECLNDLLDILSPLIGNSSPEDTTEGLIRKVCEIVHHIVMSSYEKEQDPSLKEQQERFRRRRQRASRNDDEEERSCGYDPSNDDYCEEMLNNWRIEERSINKLLKLIENFPKEMIFEILMKEQTFHEVLTFGLICPTNFKLKFTIFRFLISTLRQAKDSEIKKNFLMFIFGLLLDFRTLNAAENQRDKDGSFFKILTNLVEFYLEPRLNINLFNLADYIMTYIINCTENSNVIVLEGYLHLLRQFVLKSRELANLLLSKYNIINEVLNKCILSKCHGI